MAVRPALARAIFERPSHTRLRYAAATTSILLVAGSAVLLPQSSTAAPAVVPAATTYSTVGAFSGTVPGGTCAVRATVLGGAGGSAMSTTTTNPNGGGARISATYEVLAGQSFSGSVGAGGEAPITNGEPGGIGGTGGGGAGGSSGDVSGTRHAGAGGGGYSQLTLGSDLAVLAGGGGGSAGGHSATAEGVGGNAGIPVSSGATAGSDGAIGRDFPGTNIVTGGAGGGVSAGGAGGTNSALAAADGTAGSSLQGGAGGPDTNPDAAGGGGGGYFGGGGGASTVAYNTQSSGAVQISGSGGGGGSSFVADHVGLGAATAAVDDIDSSIGARIAAGGRGTGAAGSVTLNWLPCEYDLAVSKSVSAPTTPTGSTVTWTVSVANIGTAPMTKGDTVSIADTLPGVGATQIASIAVSGTASPYFADGAMTCNAAVGDAMPGSLECSRPYQVVGDAVSGVRGLNAGETLTVTYTQRIDESAGATLSNTATVTDRATGDSDDSATAAVAVTALPVAPVAANDTDLDNTIGDSVAVDVVGNDGGSIVSGSVVLLDAGGTPVVGPYAVTGQGSWTVSGNVVTFTPEAGFSGDPTPVTYRVSDGAGLTVTATVTVTYMPTAADDSSHGNVVGSTVVLAVLANDEGVFDPASVSITDPATGQHVGALAVAGEGAWTVDAVTGAISFAPQAGFVGNPTPVEYSVTSTAGRTVTADVVVSYLPAATDDASRGNRAGTAVTVDVIGNDTGIFDATSVRLIDPRSGARATRLAVAGQGDWSVNAVTGAITFTPQAGFLGNPTPVQYSVVDLSGNTTTAFVTIAYTQVAAFAARGGLALTGASVQVPLAGAALLVLAGLALVVTSRSRRGSRQITY